MKICIPTYRAEAEAGVAGLVASSASVAYAVAVEEWRPEAPVAADVARAVAARLGVAHAGAEDLDLFHIRDILCSTGWNLNDDVFTPAELWAARGTSEDKPFNFEHNQDDIIGHIVANQAVDESLSPIDPGAAIDDLPSPFHILNASVIYRNVGSPERRELIERTIAEIRDGGWAVSMECFFRGFDYGMTRADGSQLLVPRTEASAFLTKHLRAYGGSGEFPDPRTGERMRLGRVLRSVTFCGKGLVRKPANPASVILNSFAAFAPVHRESVYHDPSAEIVAATHDGEAHVMPETADNAAAEALAKLAEKDEQIAGLAAEVARLKGQDFESKLAAKDEQIAAKDAAVATLTADLAAANSAKAALESDLAAARTELDAASERVAEFVASAAKAARKAALEAAGADEARASELVEKFADLNEAAFAATVEQLGAAWAAAKAARPAQTTQAQIDRIEAAQAEPEPALAVASATAEEDAEARVSAVASFFEANVLHTTARK